MTPETEAQIRNVRKFGGYARSIAGLAGAMLIIAFLLALWNIVAGPTGAGFRVGFGAYTVTGDHMSTIQLKAWSLCVVTIVFGLLLPVVLHLRRLFGHLAAGQIYTRENVRLIRRVGLLSLAMAMFQIVLPVTTSGLLATGFIDRALVTFAEPGGGGVFLIGPSSLPGFFTAALVLLASWIMDIGRQTTDEADAMRREADLVI